MNEEFVIRLLGAFSAGGAAELELEEGSLRIVLRKSVQSGANRVPAEAESAKGSAPRTDAPVRLGLSAGPEGEISGSETITSPIVATFYASPGPDTPPFVTKGSLVKKGGTLCILEAMKMMNHLEAEFDCEILAVRAAPGDMIEFGQVLFDVRHI